MRTKYRDPNWLEEQYVEKEKSCYEIAGSLDCSSSVVHKWIRKFNIEREPEKYHNRDWLHSKYIEEDMSARAISDLLDCDPKTIFNWLNKHSIKRKQPHKMAQSKYHTPSRITVYCSYCEEEIRILPYYKDKREHFFCNHECYGKWLSENQIGKDHPRWEGEELTVECAWCSKEIRKKRFQIENFDHLFCDKSCQGKWYEENRRGENSPAWKGGHSRYNYGGHNWRVQRKRARERDDYQCQICGSTENLHVHHIEKFKKFDNFREANKLENLITLCGSCHPEMESEDRRNLGIEKVRAPLP